MKRELINEFKNGWLFTEKLIIEIPNTKISLESPLYIPFVVNLDSMSPVKYFLPSYYDQKPLTIISHGSEEIVINQSFDLTGFWITKTDIEGIYSKSELDKIYNKMFYAQKDHLGE